MTRRFAVAGLVALTLAAGCARAPVSVPVLPDPGYSGLGSAQDPLGAPANVTGGTLPGSNVGDTVLFTVDETSLRPDAIGTLDAQVGWLMQNPAQRVEIQGHADERGTREYNLALGSGRASSVRNYLVSRGVPDDRVSIITFGRERPIATCADESCWSQNRRAVTAAVGGPGV